MQDLTGKVALITGASAGIGKAIATRLAQAGCTVALIASGAEKLAQAVAEIQAKGGRAEAFVCDLNDMDAFLATHKTIEAQLGPVDILINNVGLGTFKPLHLQTLAEARQPVQLPFGIAVVACHAVVPAMRRRGQGHIVNLVSPAGYFPFPHMAPYAASRWAMVGLSLCLREELAAGGIGVSLVCPGRVNTDYFARNDADMNWFPRISQSVTAVEPEAVAAKVLDAIHRNRREVIFPWLLWFYIRLYQRLPKTTLALLKMLRLWQPVRPPD